MSSMPTLFSLQKVTTFALLASACAADASQAPPLADEGSADQSVAVTTEALASGTLRLNDVYYVRASLGYDGARVFATATDTAVAQRIAPQAAVKIVIAEPSNGRYRVEHAGKLGWVAGEDLTLRHRYDATLSATRIGALARARTAMGFSYWWSNARWPVSGATTWPTNNPGVCSGVCGGSVPCTHVATGGGPEYGADCSGFVSTIWGFPDTDSTTNPTNNGYATVSYNVDSSRWSTIALSKALPGDAVVTYSETGQKHIVLVATSRDSNGKFNTYECRGCAYGCMTFARTIADGGAWHAIRRTGW